MSWYKKSSGSIRAYHGSPDKIIKFETSFAGEGHDMEGPGIYFTDNIDDAKGYGEVIEVILSFSNVVPLEGEIPEEDIKTLILKSVGVNTVDELADVTEEVFYDSNLSNWCEDVEGSFYMAINAVLNNSKSPHDAFQNVWIDNYRYEPTKYLNNMVELGYDGVIVPKNHGITHYIVFNPSIITVV